MDMNTIFKTFYNLNCNSFSLIRLGISLHCFNVGRTLYLLRSICYVATVLLLERYTHYGLFVMATVLLLERYTYYGLFVMATVLLLEHYSQECSLDGTENRTKICRVMN